MRIRVLPFLMLVSVALSSACSKQEENLPPDPKMGQTVSGKVTYSGQPINYGFVLFYDGTQHAFNDKDEGRVTPLCFSEIKDGRYKIEDAPEGIVQICVATDPDVDLHKFLHPTKAGGVSDGPEGGAPIVDVKGKGKPPIVLPPNPLTQDFSERQKELLRKIHKEYGVFGKSPLMYPVSKGKQTFDIELAPGN